MKKLSFISNLIYAVKKRLGWCPEPPAPKDVILAEKAPSQGYVEKPPISLYYLVSIVPALSLAIIIFFVGQFYHNVFVSLVGIFLIFVLVPVFTIPWIINREILLSSEELQMKFGFSKDKIEINDIVSVEPIKLPKKLRGSIRMPADPQPRGPFIPIGKIPLGVVKTKDAKWYVFGGGRTYVKIRRKSGKAVCVGMRDPEEFMNRWEMLQSQQGSSVDGGTK